MRLIIVLKVTKNQDSPSFLNKFLEKTQGSQTEPTQPFKDEGRWTHSDQL